MTERETYLATLTALEGVEEQAIALVVALEAQIVAVTPFYRREAEDTLIQVKAKAIAMLSLTRRGLRRFKGYIDPLDEGITTLPPPIL